MKGWLPRISVYGDEPHSIQAWEKIKAKGKTRFVLLCALSFGAIMVGVTHAVMNIFFAPEEFSLVRISVYLLIGIPVGTSVWKRMETNYQKALGEAGTKALPNSKNPT